MAEKRNAYKETHAREELSLELNFRSFMAGEGGDFFRPVPMEDMLSFAAVGSPISIPAAGTYSATELLQLAAAVREGGGTITILRAADYPKELLDKIEEEASGRLRRG